MKRYIGTKIIDAEPAPASYDVRGDNIAGDPGYRVRYPDGYESWSPKKAFEDAYRLADGTMTFSQALELIKTGRRLARHGWNGKGMFVFLVAGSTFKVNRPPLLGIFDEGTEINYRPHIDISTADGSIATWVPSIGDVMADDWELVD